MIKPDPKINFVPVVAVPQGEEDPLTHLQLIQSVADLRPGDRLMTRDYGELTAQELCPDRLARLVADSALWRITGTSPTTDPAA